MKVIVAFPEEHHKAFFQHVLHEVGRSYRSNPCPVFAATDKAVVEINEAGTDTRRSARAAWAKLVYLVREVDSLLCPRCIHEMRVITLIHDPLVIRRILKHLGVWAPEPVHCPLELVVHRQRSVLTPVINGRMIPKLWPQQPLYCAAGRSKTAPVIEALAAQEEVKLPMTSERKDQICALLKGIETGDEASVAVVDPDKYIQHNPQTHEGGEGLATLFKRLAKSSPSVDIVRVFSDGDYVFAHTEYDFGSPKIGFEIFRFEGDLTVEHWDNIQPREGPNPSGHTMVDGPTEATDLDRTEYNREIVRSFVDEVLINDQLDRLEHYIDGECFTEHNPRAGDGLSAMRSALSDPASNDDITIQYHRNHRILAEGSFVLTASEGSINGVHSSFYDLFRIADGKLVEHWDTTESIPPRSEWKNDNGKF